MVGVGRTWYIVWDRKSAADGDDGRGGGLSSAIHVVQMQNDISLSSNNHSLIRGYTDSKEHILNVTIADKSH